MKFQSTRPCGTRLVAMMSRMFCPCSISIHAPLWDATRLIKHDRRRTTKISIHAPLWDATKWYLCFIIKDFRFQSTRPCGTRQCKKQGLNVLVTISIHAPLWDATTYHFLYLLMSSVFQSTRPCRTRQTVFLQPPKKSLISIHAPLWDATFS